MTDLEQSTVTDDSARAEEIAQKAQDLLLVFKDPAAAAVRLGAWIQEKYPERISAAYWVTIDADRDKGIGIEVYRLPADLHLKVLLGAWSGGIGIFHDVAVGTSPAKLSIGLAAVRPYAAAGGIAEGWTLAAGITVHL